MTRGDADFDEQCFVQFTSSETQRSMVDVTTPIEQDEASVLRLQVLLLPLLLLLQQLNPSFLTSLRRTLRATFGC